MGIRDEDIRAIIARGTHRPCTDEEVRVRVGSEILGRFEVMQHDCRDYLPLTSSLQDGDPALTRLRAGIVG